MRAVLGLGANLGDPLTALRTAVDALGLLPHTAVTAVSSVYQTAPVGYADQPDFYNIVVTVETALTPHALLGGCFGIEAALGRVRTFRNAPRVVDIDLLLYEGYCEKTEELTVPHPRMMERAFVLVPLAELFPEGEALGVPFENVFSPDVRRIGEL
ncbi:MAG: 2-amino-4-hydroxy-6-hydroxymethyldihydropteridine diphosphokinase [Ruminococcaceae bacterium]|nr:2-amino-4-hydroxy-6-hydroxymethyldihydropteridine diphosphokinase [Oscillospiraceae bacterium]